MADIRSKISEIYTLEQLSSSKTSIHSIHPLAKILATMVYIICILSFNRYEISGLVPYIFYPIIILSMTEIPYQLILKRVFVALPFCLFAGISNLLVDKAVLLKVGIFFIRYGMISFLAVLGRTFLCVTAVLILVAVTPVTELTVQLGRMGIPSIFIKLLEMTYRYISTLLEEASSMSTAYHLRSPNTKGLQMKHMGSFVGQLLIRSFDRAERVYEAMKCRGYGMQNKEQKKRPLKSTDYLFLFLVCGSSILFRWINLSMLLRRFF